MKGIWRIAIFSLTCMFAGNAGAEITGYFGGSAGRSKTNDACDDLSGCDDTDAGWKVFTGILLDKKIGLEATYADLGEASGNFAFSDTIYKFRTETRCVTIAGLGRIPVNEQFAILARVGTMYYDLDVRATGGGASVSDDDQQFYKLTFGIGAQYEVNDHLGIRAEWEWYRDIEYRPLDIEENISLISAGVVYNF